jgi:hypothetical protein
MEMNTEMYTKIIITCGDILNFYKRCFLLVVASPNRVWSYPT